MNEPYNPQPPPAAFFWGSFFHHKVITESLFPTLYVFGHLPPPLICKRCQPLCRQMWAYWRSVLTTRAGFAGSCPNRKGSRCVENQVKVTHSKMRKKRAVLYLVLGLLQIPTSPQGEPQTMADLRLVLTPCQLLGKPQACRKKREKNGSR